VIARNTSQIVHKGFRANSNTLSFSYSDRRKKQGISDKSPFPLFTKTRDQYGNISLEVFPIEQYGGQSGGSLSSLKSGEPLGLIKQSIRFDETAYLIPMKAVCSFAQNGDGPEVTQGRDKSNTQLLKRFCETEYLSRLNSGVKTQSSGVKTQSSGVKTQSSGVKTQSSGVKTQSSGVKTQSSGVKTQSSGVKTQSSGVKTKSTNTKNYNNFQYECTQLLHLHEKKLNPCYQENTEVLPLKENQKLFISNYSEGIFDSKLRSNLIAYRCDENSKWIQVLAPEDHIYEPLGLQGDMKLHCKNFEKLVPYDEKSGKGNIVYREHSKSKLPLSIRKTIIKRLAGKYTSKISRRVNYKKNNNSQYSKDDSKNINIKINIDEQRNTLHVKKSENAPKGLPSKTFDTSNTYKISYAKNYTRVKLTHSQTNELYTCPITFNLNLLQCNSIITDSGILLSSTGGVNPQLRYRNVTKMKTNILKYEHGILRSNNEQ
jgi:hypothetical protein